MAHVLIIDDDDAIRTVLAEALTATGHIVRLAADGNIGLRLFRAAPADLVLTDLVMPEKEGLATIMELRREFPGVRIIAMSGGFAHDAGLYLHLAARLGAVRVLRKPFRIAELTAAIAEVLGGGAEPPVDPEPCR